MLQPLPTQGKQSVTRELMALLDARERKGIETYGRTLETFNGRDPHRDALEEAIDLAQYFLQAKLEAETRLKSTLHRVDILELALTKFAADGLPVDLNPTINTRDWESAYQTVLNLL